jgi:signal transduction histidine kinase
MHEIEIQEIPPLSAGEHSLVRMHSVVNTINVLIGELTMTGFEIARDERHFSEGLRHAERFSNSLSDPDAALAGAAEVDELRRVVLDEFEAKVPASRSNDPEIALGRSNLQSALAILQVRAREILARAGCPDPMKRFELALLARDLDDFLAAMERNSRGRYRIVRNISLKTPTDYYFDFKVESSLSGPAFRAPFLYMPHVFQDVMRDLIANARKYTAVGGNILAAARQDREGVVFAIEDNGRGIPPGQIRDVVQFGKRANNVGDVRSLGGGFGLTKAFLATKQFGGRFWIASELGRGTRVRIQLPITPPAV